MKHRVTALRLAKREEDILDFPVAEERYVGMLECCLRYVNIETARQRQPASAKLFETVQKTLFGDVFTYCSDKPGLSTKIVLDIWSKLMMFVFLRIADTCWERETQSPRLCLAGVGSITRTTAC